SMVEVESETFLDEVTNKASLHFVIREGHQIKVKDINIYGNDSFKDRKIKRLIKSKTKNIFRGGYLKEDLLGEDMDRIAVFYEQQGYIDAQVNYEVDHQYKGKVEVNVNVEEGKRYTVGDVLIKGNDIVSEKEIRRVMKVVDEGGIFSREKLKLDVANVRSLYFDRGYIFAKIVDAASLDGTTGMVDIKIDVEEGGLAYIEKVQVEGNTRTRDIVVRRELRLYPGDRFDGSKLRRSKERLSNLGYFEDVSFDIQDTDVYDRKNLVVQVKEAKTGSFSFGGGFSTVDRVVGFVEIEQRNFDIMNWPTFVGGGQRLQLRAETGSSKNNMLLSFTEPWVFDRPISFGFDIYSRQRDRESDTGYAYDEERIGAALRLSKQFGEHNRAGVSYKWEDVEISNFEANVSAALLAEAGSNVVSVLGFNYQHDKRNSVFSPSKGWVFNGNADVAGSILGGDKDFYRLTAGGSYYVPLMLNSVLEFKAKAGIVDAYGDSSTVPIFERFFAGGANSIRGYEQRGVGPHDATTNDPIGGEAMLVSTVEYTMPIIDFLKLAVFFDSGNVWADVGDFGTSGFKSGVGAGARVKTPIGPISLDYGYPLSEPDGRADEKGQFYFNVSRGF
ncbi:MAG: outer membrane protein insertion porin family, partial [Lysobacterales bacterium]